jgi:hypothetical protein
MKDENVRQHISSMVYIFINLATERGMPPLSDPTQSTPRTSDPYPQITFEKKNLSFSSSKSGTKRSVSKRKADEDVGGDASDTKSKPATKKKARKAPKTLLSFGCIVQRAFDLTGHPIRFVHFGRLSAPPRAEFTATFPWALDYRATGTNPGRTDACSIETCHTHRYQVSA